MKTPEEIKDEVARRHDFKSWNYVVDEFTSGTSISFKEFKEIENETMIAYHTSTLGDAGSELLSDEEIVIESKVKYLSSYTHQYAFENGSKFMKEKSSLLLVKEREEWIKSIDSLQAEANKVLEQKEKDINGLKELLYLSSIQFDYLNRNFGELASTNNILSKIKAKLSQK